MNLPLILSNQVPKCVLHALCLLSNWIAAGVQCGGLEFAQGSPAGVEQDTSSPSCSGTNTSCPDQTNTLTILFNSSTIPDGAQNIVCGVTTNNATAEAWEASKWSHMTRAYS